MNIIQFTRHTASPSNLQSTTEVDNEQYQYIYTDDSNDSLVYQVTLQTTLFMALKQVREINRINGYQVFSDWDIRRIKKHYMITEKTKGELCKGDLKNKISRGQKEKYESNNTQRDIARDMRIGYMKMLSAYQSSI